MTINKASRQRTPMDMKDPGTKRPAKLSADIKSKIGFQLRQMYDEYLSQGVPSRLAEILRELDDEREEPKEPPEQEDSTQ
jgi:anti-sigma factor NepR-like protein